MICKICGKVFKPRFTVRSFLALRDFYDDDKPRKIIKRTPLVYCSDKCRKIARRDYHRNYRREQRKMIAADNRGMCETSRREEGNVWWDFIPRRKRLVKDKKGNITTKVIPAMIQIGTVTGKDLRIIDTEDGPRVAAAYYLEKKKKRVK